MNRKAGIAGAAVLGLALNAGAFTSPYSSMAMPGTHNEWNITPSMVLAADNVWVGTQTFSSVVGSNKFAANGSWGINWGGNALITRVPAVASAPTLGGGDLKYNGLSNGAYRVTFNDTNFEYRFEWAGGSPLPLPAFTNVSLVGGFNGWIPDLNQMTNPPGNTNLWLCSVDLEAETAFQFLPNYDWSLQYGAPEGVSLPPPVVNASACGKSDITLSGFEPGTFQFSLNTSNATYSVSQISTQSFTLMAVQGNFVATNNPPPNMMKAGGTALWESDHHVTNSGTLTLRFSGNNGARRWGATNSTPAYALPAAGAMSSGQTNYAQVTGVTPGRYRITFNHQSGAFTLRQSYTNDSGVNLLANPGFEETTEGDAGGNAVGWTNWQAWPKVFTNGFAPHSGRWCGAIHGKLLPDWDDYGSFSQNLLVTSGKIYRAAAWFKASPDWSAESMQIKIEWRDATNGAVGIESVLNLPALTTNWVKYSVEGTAPTNATRAQVIFLCAGANTAGTMHVDDAECRIVAGRTQNFDTWDALALGFAPFAPDWSVTSGMVVENVAPGRPPAEVFISQYVEGTGNNKAVEIFNGTLSNINLAADGYNLQQYHNGSLTASVTIALSGTLVPSAATVVGRPSTPPAYAPDLAISGLPNLQTNKDLTFNGDDVLVLRRGTNVLDRVGRVQTGASASLWSRSAKDHTLTRKQTIFTGTITAVTSAFPLAEWTISAKDTFGGLGSHEISYLDPNEPYTPAHFSLVMNCGATLMSGELPGGIGDISFYWRTESMAPPVTLAIETAPAEDGPWTEAATLTDVASSNFAYYVAAINRADAYYLRLRQTDLGTNRFRVDEIVISEYTAIPRLQDFNAWTDPAYEVPGSYSRSGWTLQSAAIDPTNGVSTTRAARFTPPDSAVLCPAFEGGLGEFRFWGRAVDAGITNRLWLQTTVDGGSNWVVRDRYTVSTAQTFATWLYITNIGAQARLSFDTNYNSADTFVDNVEVRLPVLYRSQNFNGWPASSGYITNSFQGWTVNNGLVGSQNAYDIQAARLNSTVGNFVLSPEIPDGLGAISFRVAKWPGDTTPNIDVQLSPNGTSWITFTNVSASTTNYLTYLWYLLDTSNRFVRLYHSSGVGRALIDDIVIGLPLPRPQVLVTPSLDPAAPYYEDPMRILANVVSRYGADILTVTGAYQIATNGTTNFVQMTSAQIGSYTAVSEIPAQPAGTMVRYFVTVRYAGIGANSNFSGYATNSYTTAFYTNYVSSVPLGHVWINEIFYAPYGDEPIDTNTWEWVGCNHEFVELCGRAGVSISNWTVQLLFGADADIAKNGGQPVYASYKITAGHTFTNQTNSFSFYVLGDQELATNYPINKYLTTYVSTNVAPFAVDDKDHIYDRVGVVRLLNEYSNVVYALSYGGYAAGADYIRQSQPSFGASNSLGLKGSNYTYTGFVWSNNTITAGGVNAGQILAEPPPDSNVYAWAWHTQDQQITPVNTNAVPPFYMLDPWPPAHFDIMNVYYGFTNADYPNPDGTLYHRRTGSGWSTLDMNIRDASLDAAGRAYVYAGIPDHTYRRLQTIEYVVEVIPNKTGVERVYLGSDAGGNNLSTIYTNLAGAQAHPFTYPVPIGDQIYITNLVLGTTSVVFGTEGNDIADPLTNFYVKVGTNLRAPTSLWISTNFTAVRDIYSNYTFTVPRATSTWSNVFYRVDPRWP